MLTEEFKEKVRNHIIDQSPAVKNLGIVVANSKPVTNVTNFVKKVKPENIFSGVTSVGATAYVSTVDEDGNGVADIAEKGINAYKGALKHIDFVKDLVDMLS